MSEVATQTPDPGAVSKREPPAPGQDTGSWSNGPPRETRAVSPRSGPCLPIAIAAESCREAYGSSADWLRQSIIKKAGNGDVRLKRRSAKNLTAVRSELEGPNPTPIERLLAERASLCWFIVNSYEIVTPHRRHEHLPSRFPSTQDRQGPCSVPLAPSGRGPSPQAGFADPPTQHREEPSQLGGGPVVSRTETARLPIDSRAVDALAGADPGGRCGGLRPEAW